MQHTVVTSARVCLGDFNLSSLDLVFVVAWLLLLLNTTANFESGLLLICCFLRIVG